MSNDKSNIMNKLDDDDFTKEIDTGENFFLDIEKSKNEKNKEEKTNTKTVKKVKLKKVGSKKDKNESDDKEKVNTNVKHPFIDLFIFITIIFSLIYFMINITNKDVSILNLVNSTILCLFSIVYLCICITYNRKNKKMILLSSVILLSYFLININNSLNIVKTPVAEVANLSGRSITQAIKWADKNNIKVTQVYEFSDSVPEYKVIGQSVKAGTSLDGVDEMVITISEGPNPYKEIIVPSMITWDSERVINYVNSNYLTNVVVEFVESDKVKDTVIEQSKSGNLLRNDELKLTFSYGDAGNSDTVSMISFDNMSKFEIEFFMKQHHLNYQFEYDFSSKVKKGYGLDQDVKFGEEATVNGKSITVTISKGPKIKVPKLTDMDINGITEWAVKNKLKLEFANKYDDSVKQGKVISTDKEVGDIIEQGSTIKVTLSLGSLKMPKFDDADSFYSWADLYGIVYEIIHEYSDSIEAGKIIRFSPNKGEVLKNDEVIKVTVSDGIKRSVPNVVGLTKSQASNKMKDAGLNCNFVYSNNTATKDKVLSQSISAGSDVPNGTTVTITLSNGKKPTTNSNSSGSSSKPSTPSQPSQPAQPTCNKVDYTISRNLNNVFNSCDGFSGCKSAIESFFASNYPNVKISVVGVDSAGASGNYVGGIGPGSSISSCNSTPYEIQIAK